MAGKHFIGYVTVLLLIMPSQGKELDKMLSAPLPSRNIRIRLEPENLLL